MEIISPCGNRCDLCPAYIKNIDRFSAKTVSEGWDKYLEYDCPPEKIPCVGCEEIGNHPNDYCPIRECVREKDLKNCACCKEMPCADLYENIEELERLEATHKDIGKREYEMYYKPYHNYELLKKLRKEADGHD